MQAKHGDRVFVNIDCIGRFLQAFLIWGVQGKKFVIACQNADTEFNRYWLQKLKPHALHIYTINCVIEDPMITTIPLGFGDWSLDIIPTIQVSEPRTIEILAGFLVRTNPLARQTCLDAMKKDPRAITDLTTKREEYYQRLAITKYAVCPEGTGHDTHRVYESIYFGAVPILLRSSQLTHLYKDMPIKWVDSWESLDLDWDADKAKLDLWVAENPGWATRALII
jgi:hypothetical protein